MCRESSQHRYPQSAGTVPALVAKPERDIIGKLKIAEQNGQIITGVDMVRAAPVEYPFHTLGEYASIAHIFYTTGDLVIERELGIFKDCGSDLEKVIHQVGMHPTCSINSDLSPKQTGNAVVVSLPEQLGIPVTGNLVKESQDIRLPLLQLLDKRPGKGK